MRNLIKKALLGLAAILSLCACHKPAQAFLKDSQGQRINPAAWRNHWVIVNYWASWCYPCAAEIPQLNLFYQRHKNQVILVGVNFDGLSGNSLLFAIHALHIQFPVLQSNPAKVLGLPQSLEVVPTTFIIDPQGHIVSRLSGPQTATRLEKAVHV